MRAHLAAQRGDRALVPHQRRGLVEVLAAHAREGMVDAGVDIDLDVLATGQRFANCALRLRRAETILLGDMQHQPAAHVAGLAQCMLDADAVVRHRAGHVGQPAGRQVSQLAAQAEAQHAGLADAFRARAQCLQCRAHVLHALGFVELLIEPERALEILAAIGQLDAGREAPEQVGNQHRVTLFGVIVGDLPHGGIDAEDLLAQHDSRALACRGNGEITAETAFGGLDLDGLAHGLLSLSLSLDGVRWRRRAGFHDGGSAPQQTSRPLQRLSD
ncbi:hypothetical protein D3C72_1166440 [compost metagenome]